MINYSLTFVYNIYIKEKHIRAYYSALAFASLSVNLDTELALSTELYFKYTIEIFFSFNF